jgi:hypothetical protein
MFLREIALVIETEGLESNPDLLPLQLLLLERDSDRNPDTGMGAVI